MPELARRASLRRRSVRIAAGLNSIDPAQLENRFLDLRREPLRCRIALARSLLRMSTPRAIQHLGYAGVRDYVRGRLGIPWGAYRSWVRVATALLQCARLDAELRAGLISWSAAEELARALPLHLIDAAIPHARNRSVQQIREWLRGMQPRTASRDPEHSSNPSNPSHSCGLTADSEAPPDPEPPSETDPRHIAFAMAVPFPVAVYAEHTLRVAEALLGRDSPIDERIEAVVAEASTEIQPTAGPDEAWHRFHAFLGARSRRRNAGGVGPSVSRCPSANEPATAACARKPRETAATAVILDRWIRRQLDRLRQSELDLEDCLLQLQRIQAHHRHGFSSFAAYTREILQLPESTSWDLLRRARLRQLGDPIAIARGAGDLSAVKSEMLQRVRRLGIPASCLQAWVNYATAHTTQRLREAATWARLESARDHRSWTLADCPPPTDAELRTSTPSLEHIARAPDIPSSASMNQAPFTRLKWHLDVGVAQLLAQLMASIQDRASDREPGGRPLPAWEALLSVFAHARRAWSELVPTTQRRYWSILARDDYRCAAPECSHRRDLHVHHIRYRSRRGGDASENRVTLCATHHQRCLHELGSLRIFGSATDGRFSLQWILGQSDRQGARNSQLERFAGERRLSPVSIQPSPVVRPSS